MPSRELLKRLELVTDWTKIPKKDKSKKMLWIYFIDDRENKRSKKFVKAWFISYKEEDKYVLLRFPNSAFLKKFKGKDKIYVDPNTLYKKDMKGMVKGWKPKEDDKKSKKKKKPRPLTPTPPRKRGGKKILLNF